MRDYGFILSIITLIGIIIILGNYALQEGRKIEEQKKLRKNLKNYDDKRKNSQRSK